jgi:hypothetical protein
MILAFDSVLKTTTIQQNPKIAPQLNDDAGALFHPALSNGCAISLDDSAGTLFRLAPQLPSSAKLCQTTVHLR